MINTWLIGLGLLLLSIGITALCIIFGWLVTVPSDTDHFGMLGDMSVFVGLIFFAAFTCFVGAIVVERK